MISRAARFAIALFVLAADRATKFWIEQNVGPFDTLAVIPGVFNIIHAQNRGAAFGFLNQTEGPLRAILLIGVSSAVMLFLAYELWRLPRGSFSDSQGGSFVNLPIVAIALILGGAAGNLFDRVARGSVTDFLQVFIGSYEWPSFNVADSAITIGAICLMLSLLRFPSQSEAKHVS